MATCWNARGEQHVAVRRTLLAEVRQEPVGPREPALSLSEVSFVDEMEAQPERAADGLMAFAVLDVKRVGALQGLDAVADVAEQIRGHGQQFQVDGSHRRCR